MRNEEGFLLVQPGGASNDVVFVAEIPGPGLLHVAMASPKFGTLEKWRARQIFLAVSQSRPAAARTILILILNSRVLLDTA